MKSQAPSPVVDRPIEIGSGTSSLERGVDGRIVFNFGDKTGHDSFCVLLNFLNIIFESQCMPGYTRHTQLRGPCSPQFGEICQMHFVLDRSLVPLLI